MKSVHGLAENERLRIAFQLEKLVASADQWVRARQLRNRLVHEYVRDRRALAVNLNEAHALVGLLENTLDALRRVLTPYLDAEP